MGPRRGHTARCTSTTTWSWWRKRTLAHGLLLCPCTAASSTAGGRPTIPRVSTDRQSIPPDRVVHQAVRQATVDGAAHGQWGAIEDLKNGEEEGDHEDREDNTRRGEPALLQRGEGAKEHQNIDY